MVISVGEVLVDMIGTKHKDNVLYESFIGGAPFNLACNIKKLGGKVGFIGTIGDDLLGKFLFEKIIKINLNFTSISFDYKHNTTVALVNLDKTGERSFSFLRKNCADYFIDVKHIIKCKTLEQGDIIHIGSLMLSEKEGQKNFNLLINEAKKLNKLVSFDINYREDLFDDNIKAMKCIDYAIKEADILKFSEDELYMLTKTNTLEEAIKLFNYNQIVFITLSSLGSACFYKGKIIKAPTIEVKPVDTTGAGDAFYAATLKQLDELNIDELTESQIKQLLKFSNVCGGLTTTSKGAIDAFPSKRKIKKYSDFIYND